MSTVEAVIFDQALIEERDYWLEKLSRDSIGPNFTGNSEVTDAGSGERSLVEIILTDEVNQRLKSLSGGSSFLTYTILMAGLKVCLQRHTGLETVVVGSPALKEMDGPNALAIVDDIDPQMPFRDFLLNLRNTLLEAYARQRYPIRSLLEDLGFEGGDVRCPLFDVVLKLDDIHGDIPDLGSDIIIVFSNEGEVISGSIEFNCGLFTRNAMEQFSAHFVNILQQALEGIEIPLGRLEVMTEADRRRYLAEWSNGPAIHYGAVPVHRFFEGQVERGPDATAVVFEGLNLSYRELNRRANMLAHRLLAIGVGPESLVGLCMERSVEMTIAILGILKAGGAYLPLDPQYPQERFAFMLDDSSATVLLTQEQLIDRLPEHTAQVIYVDDDEVQAHSQLGDHNPTSLATADNSIYVIYTSGSTGRPKGVPVQHRSLANFLRWSQQEMPLGAGDRVLQKTSISFDASVWELFAPLSAGACLVLARPGGQQDGEYLAETIEEEEITHLKVVPSLLRLLLNERKLESCRGSLKQIMCGGEALTADLAAEVFQQVDAALFNMYGPTEATIDATYHEVASKSSHSGKATPIGRPLANTQTYVLDGNLQPTPRGVAGQLFIGGNGLARGYLNRPDLSADRFIPDPFSSTPGSRLYATGDLVRLLPEGVLDFLGRIDHQVKLRGYRIELGEIESALRRHPAIRDAVVAVPESDREDKRLAAYLVLNVDSDEGVGPQPDHSSNEEARRLLARKVIPEVRDYLNEKLPAYMVPAVFVTLEKIPLTSSGKVDRRALPAPDGTLFGSEGETIEPRTEAEKILADIWAEALGLEKVGINDNFFQIGGDSIISIQIISRANRAGLRLRAEHVFRHQTIAELAAAAGTGPRIESKQGIISGPVPLTPIQHLFFEQDLPERHHYNQAVLLEVDPSLDANCLETVVRHLLMHHDALRLRFSENEAGWRQFNGSHSETVPFIYIDLSGLPEKNRVPEMEGTAEKLQSRLDLSHGPLLRVALFNLGKDVPRRLFIGIHHLAVDGVSWRILLEDLESACLQAMRGEQISLPPKTTSFKDWAESLTGYARTDRLDNEREYWTERSRKHAPRLPRDTPAGINSFDSTRKLTVSLTAEETESLLREVPNAYRTQIGDVLLTALAQAFRWWTGEKLVLVDLEGHGREEIIENVDLSRTVGWFTTVYPVLLTVDATTGAESALKSVKEQIRSVPNRGIGYGLLRYLSEDHVLRERLASMPKAEVSFNYLGQFDPILARSSLFNAAVDSSGKNRSGRGKRKHLLEINASIVSGCLQATWAYSENLHQRSTIEGLAEEFMRALSLLIRHCRSQERVGFTPSDFPLAKLNQQQLDRLALGYRAVEDIYPLTAFQKGLLFHTLLAPEARLYSVQLKVRINSVLDVPAFEKSWQRVIQRHPILRTAFLWEGFDEPLQVVQESVNVPLTFLDWRELGHDEQQERMDTFLKADQEQPLKLAEAPLLRLALIQLASDDYLFVWTYHHLLLDGWALYLVIKDLFAFYDDFNRGIEPAMKKATPFRDYIEWLQQQDMAAAEAFWRRTVKGITAPTPLGDRNDAELSDEPEYANQRVKLSSEVTTALKAFAQQHLLTMNTLVQGAWALALSFDSGEMDVVFGGTVSGRPAALGGVESIVGAFINTLPVRVTVEPERLLVDWLTEIQSQQIEAREYDYTPLVSVQSWSDVPKGKPLFESLFLFENYPVDASVQQEGRKLRITEVTVSDKANYPLSVFAMPSDELSLRMAYDISRFDDATISRMLGHLRTALEGMPARAASRVLDLPLLTPAEQSQVLFEWNATSRPYPEDCCIHEIFEAQADLTPDRIAVIFNDEQLTYAELNSRANQLAHHLRALGIEAEERVAVCIDRSLEMAISLLGILKAGGAYVPIDPGYPLERVSYMLEDAQSSVIVTKEDQLDEMPATWAQPVCLDTDWESIAQAPSHNPGPTTVPENVAYMIYTSGSTGTPKGVLVTHRTLVNSTLARFDYYNAVDKFILLSSFAFDSSVAGIFWSICQGGSLVLPEEGGQKDPRNVVELICREQVSNLLTVPSYYVQLMAQADVGQFRSLDTAIIAGEAWPRELVERHAQLSPRTRIYNEYGPTEGTVWSSVFEAEPGDEKTTVPIGRPINNVQIYILNSRLAPVPVGVAGHLYLGGSGLARGYYNQPELTASKFVPGVFGVNSGERLYYTGDLARFLPDGNIEFLGRADQQVKIRGYRIELEEIESVLMQMPSVREAVVAAREDVPGDKRLVAYVIPVEGQEPTVGEFRSFLDQKLPGYMVPSAFICLDELPVTPNGKVDRRALPAPDESRPNLESAFAEPRTDIERALAEIWSRVLHVERVGVHDNFFELGGDSILSIQVLSRAREQGLNLSLQQMFRNQTIAQLAGELAELGAGEDEVLLTEPFGLISQQDRSKLAGDIEDAYPLSRLQAGMIFHSELSTDTAVYHSIISARLRGPLDIQILRAAAQRVVDRHPLFRTSIRMTGFDEPLQLVHRTANVRLEMDDLRHLSSSEQETELAAWLEAEKLRHFDWACPPLLRMRVHRWTDDTFQFTLTAHHAIMDGWSDSLCLTELFKIYLSLLHGWSDPSEPSPIATFRDYVALERRALETDESRRYWTDKLAESSMTVLPRSDRSKNTAPYHRINIPIPGSVSQALRELAISLGLPLKSVLLAAHQRVLSVLSGQRDVTTGLVANGRTESGDGEKVIGLFLNTLPFRQELSGGTWIDLIKNTFENETELLPHRRYPLAQIQRDLGGRALFEHCFNYVHFHLFKSIQESSEIEVLSHGGVAETNYALVTHFAAGISSSDLGLAVDCDQREINEEQLRRIGDYYIRALEAMANAPHERYENCSLLSAEERKQLVVEWNETEASFPQDRCMHELFEEQVRRSPSSIAVSCEGDELTYFELNRRANRLAGSLVAEGVGPDFVVPLLAERGPDLLTSILGVFKAGGAYLPIDPFYPEGRILQILQQSRPPLVLASRQFEPELTATLERMPGSERPRLLIIEDLLQADRYNSNITGRSKPKHLAYVIYTSGSTGLPKGAMVEHIGMLNHLYAKISALDLGPDDLVAQTASQCFDISVWQYLAALLVGGRVEVFKDDVSHDAARLLQAIERHEVTIIETVPSLLRAMLDEAAFDLERNRLLRLRWMIPTGEALPPELCRSWLTLYPHIPILNAYGPTECSDDVTHYAITEPMQRDAHMVPIGRALANTRIYILDEFLSPAPIGVVGELYVGGVGVGRGYLNDDARTKEAFLEDPFAEASGARLYRTGDLARYRPDGNIEFLGRKDSQVKIRGFRIELQEIETVIRSQNEVRQAVVLPWGEDGNKRLVAYIVWQGEPDITTSELRKRLSQVLPDYMVPREFVELAEMPLTANGKIDRRSLQEPKGSDAESGERFVEPRTATEELVADIWADVLGLDRVGILDNFFEIGGHSLLATQAVSRIRHAFNLDLPLRSLFEHPTAAELSYHLDLLAREHAQLSMPPIEPIDLEQYRLATDDGDSAETLVVPASFAQQRLWVLNQLDPDSAAYNIPAAVRLSGHINIPAFQSSLHQMGLRHASLRTTFASLEGEAVQVIAAAPPVGIRLVDLSGLERESAEAAALRLAASEARKGFDLERGPLVRASLVRLAEDDHIALIIMHHIISDGWSGDIFIREMSALYESFSGGYQNPLSELSIQYPDYAVWQRRWMEGEELDRQLSYWRQQIEGADELLALPTDRPRPAVKSHQGARLSVEYDEELVQQLKRLSRREGATLYMTLLAAFQVLLHRYSGQAHIPVGTLIAGRSRKEIEELIGFFVNTLVMKADVSGGPTFIELLRQVREVALSAYAHQDLPFEKLVEEINPSRSLSHSPLFQVMFAWQNTPASTIEVTPRVEMRRLELYSGAVKSDLLLEMRERDRGLNASWEYSTDLFDADTIRRMQDHFYMLLKSIVAQPEVLVAELEMLTPAEKEQILKEWNQTESEVQCEKLIQEMFEEQVEQKPDAIAIVWEEHRLSYRELNERANRVAWQLIEKGAGPDNVVGLYMGRGLEAVIGLMGILKAGAAYVPLDPGYPAQRLEYMVKDSGTRLLVTEERLLDRLPAEDIEVVLNDTTANEIAEQAKSNPIPPDSSNLAYILYTSGSTGTPKGVAIQHRSVTSLSGWARDFFGAEKMEGVLASTSFCFDLSVFELLVTLSLGGRVILAENGLQLHELPARMEVSLVNTVPSVMAELLTSAEMPCSVQTVNLAGEQLPTELVETLCRQGSIKEVINLYGPSEDTTYSTCGVMESDDRALPHIGRPIADAQVYVLDERLNIVPVGVTGEIYIAGLGQARGYLDKAELTARSFIPNPFSDEGGRMYRSGDLARYRADGNLEFLGRKDSQVKIRGFRIELQEIQEALRLEPEVKQAAVMVRGDNSEKKLVAYLVWEENPIITTLELQRRLSQRLPDHMVPRTMVVLDRMPLTPNGKIDTRLLPEPEQLQSASGESDARARTATEELVADIWADVLRLDRVGIFENFFEMGGHSLLATQVVSRIRACFKIELPLRKIFESPTVASLAETIDREMEVREGIAAPAIQPIARDGNPALSFAQQRLWLVDQVLPGKSVYNMPFAARFKGRLNYTVLAHALQEIVRRHEVLRTNIVEVDGQPMQILHPAHPVPLSFVDLNELTKDQREIDAERLIQDEALRPFDLANGPLLRTTLIELSSEDHIVLCSMHHIVSDGWSTGVLVKELVGLYEAFATGGPSPLQELPIQYADFARWQRSWIQGEVLRGHLDYWKRQLGDNPPVLRLPTDRPRLSAPTYDSARVVYSIPVDVSNSLKAVSRGESVTMFMTLFAAFQTLLYRCTDQDDMIVGTAIANRNRAETESLIGFFVNLLALRTDLSGDPTFRELLGRVREVALGAYAHQDLPFEMLVQELRPERKPSVSPLLQVVFVYQNAPMQKLTLPDASLNMMGIEKSKIQFDMILSVTEVGDGLYCQLSYSTDLFNENTVERLLNRFGILLGEIARDPGARISEFRLISDDESSGFEPAHFPKAKLNQKDFENFLAEIGVSAS